MLKKVAGRLFDLQCQRGILSDKERSLYEYAYVLLLSRIIIYSIILVFGIVTGTCQEILSFLLPFTILRQYTGGIHLEKSANCMIVSSIIVIGCGQYLATSPGMTVISVIVWTIAVVIIWVFVPVDTPNKKLDSVEKKVYGRRARIVLILEFFVACVLLFNRYILVAEGIAAAHIILADSLVLGMIQNFFTSKVRIH